jgi:hypothetical protein
MTALFNSEADAKLRQRKIFLAPAGVKIVNKVLGAASGTDRLTRGRIILILKELVTG